MTDTPPSALARRPTRQDDVLHAELCVISAGSGGLSLAAGAVQIGGSVILVVKHLMGGDCLNTVCVPSKALLAAAHAAAVVRAAPLFGVDAGAPVVDIARVHAHVHGVIAAIAPHDSVERFEGLGVSMIQGIARLTGSGEVQPRGQRVRRAAMWSPSAPPPRCRRCGG